MPHLSQEDAVDALYGKRRKEDVNYSKGLPNSHCGPVPEWPTGACEHFMNPAGCGKVRGVIKPEMWCRLWNSRDTDG